MINAYENQYFYFQDKGDTARLVRGLQERLGIEGSLHDAHRHSNRLLKELVALDEVGIRGEPINRYSQRVEGRVLRFYLDATGMRLSDLEGGITKITGPNGQAGIENPRFPEGEELKVQMARLTATMISDAHLRESGRITYNENDPTRIEKVEEILNRFGDIKMEGGFRKGVYEIHVPCQIGLALIHDGMKPGDKTILNPDLPEFISSGSEKVKRAYLEELIPEDGTFDPSNGFSWFRSHALHAGNKADQYQFKPKVTQAGMDLIKTSGKPLKGTVEQTYISFGNVMKLQEHNDSSISDTAKKLVEAVLENPNRLIEDERKIAESMGIQITQSPENIKFFPKSGRLSVKWRATTTTRDDAIRWAEISPPNDVKKRDEVEDWLQEIVEDWLERMEWRWW